MQTPRMSEAVKGIHHSKRSSRNMAEFKYAKALVEKSIMDGIEPELASWF